VRRLEVKRYNGFSPNGDMSNEYYIMQGLVYADDFTLSFINSLGSTIRTLSKEDVEQLDYDPSMIEGGLREDEMVVWDGRAENGNLVASGTYYFVLTYTIYTRDYQTEEITNTTTVTFKDYVVVVRE
jgi:flagellar hook assembly protein FlgD